MSTTTKTTVLTNWSRNEYTNAGKLFDTIREIEPDLPEATVARVALYAWNNNETFTDSDQLAELMGKEEEAFYGDESSPAEFAENLTRETTDLSEVPDWVAIDWDATWNRTLRFDFYQYDVILPESGKYARFFWSAN